MMSSSLCAAALVLCLALPASAGEAFVGRHYRGTGDARYLQLLDTAARMFEPDPEYQNVAMLYEPKWNGLVEGPTWDAWWIQNSYGTTYCWLPLAREPYVSFIQNAQDLWFSHQGDGKRADKNGYVAPDGCLVDAANLDACYFRQGDGRHDIHDWCIEFTEAGVVMQAELLLISREAAAIEKYLPHLERALNFVESRRDKKTGLLMGGPACNLLAPSFAGFRRPDGTFGPAFHAGIQVTYIAALDRLIELEKLAGRDEQAKVYADRRQRTRAALPQLITAEGYFLNSIDPDGTRHGEFGAAKHGYFEATVNHDAIAFRVADDEQSRRIYSKLSSIPQLRPHDLIIPNYPGYDDMYRDPGDIWSYGTWINGGHWSTCEGRMILAYYRLGHYDDARRSMEAILGFARRFRMDNPLTQFGGAVYQPNQPVNITYDAFAIPAAMMRGLFEYLYKSDRLVLIPHIPTGITQLQQLDPVRFGNKRLRLSTFGQGPISGVEINGQAWTQFTPTEVTLPYDALPEEASISILFGGADATTVQEPASAPATGAEVTPEQGAFAEQADRLRRFIDRVRSAGFGDSPESAHAETALAAIETISQRRRLLDEGVLRPLPEPSQSAADQLYVNCAKKLYEGLDKVLLAGEQAPDARRRQIHALWLAVDR